jgi:hypothetical protein
MSNQEQREKESRESADDKFHEAREQEQEQRGRLAEDLGDELEREGDRQELR